MKMAEKVRKTLETSHATSDLRKSESNKKGLEFINKMREAGAYKCDQETTVGTTEGGLNQLKSTHGFLPKV